MKNWIQNRNLLSSLLAGGMVVILFVATLSLGTAIYFLNQSDIAHEILRATDHISNEFLNVRSAEKDFMLGDFRNASFFETGESKNLTRHKTLLAHMPIALEHLANMAASREKKFAVQITAAIAAYSDSFQKLVAAYREKGFSDWGIEGEWRKAIHDLERNLPHANDTSLEVEMLQLRRNEKDYLLRGDDKYVDAVYEGLRKLAAKLESSGEGVATQQSQESVKSYEQSFRKYLTTEERVGKNDDTGLRAETRRAALKVEPLLDAISKQAALDDQMARKNLTIVSAMILIGGLGVAGMVFYFFAQSVVDPIKKLSEAAVSVGGGDLRSRINFDSENQLGTLARVFNQMIGALSALIGQVQKSEIQIGASVTAIAATSRQQQATASEIAATTTQIGATSKEISATSKELVRTMNEVSTVAEQTATLASSGQAGLSRMQESMPQVMEAADSINAKLAVLNEKAGNINQVVTTIAKVADQTNLLSLNAAIEAEKAGEYGRGFSVVAAEIRRLADQTAVATYDIEQMVKEIQSAISAGVMGMDKFSEQVRRGIQDVQQVGGQLSQIIQGVQALVPRFETVNEGMQAQATGAEQISEALLQLTGAAQQTVESLRQSTSAIDELNQVSGDLRSSVCRFKVGAA